MKTQKGSQRTTSEVACQDDVKQPSERHKGTSEHRKNDSAATPSHQPSSSRPRQGEKANLSKSLTKLEDVSLAEMMVPTPVAIDSKPDMVLWSLMCKQAAIKPSLVKVDARGRVAVMDKRRIERELYELYDHGLDRMRTDRRLREHVDNVREETWEKTVIQEILERRVFVEHYLKLFSIKLTPENNFLSLKDGWPSKTASQKQVKYQVDVKWSQVQMPEMKERPFTFKSDCPSEVADDRRKKSSFEPCRTYVKLGNHCLRNLYDYVAGIQSGSIRLSDHIALSAYLEKQRILLERLYRQPIAITTDDVEVPILQFRFELKKR
jgi:hypothetical protein